VFYVDRLWHPIHLNFETSKNPIKILFSCDVKKLNTFVREHPRTWKKLYFFKSSSKLQLVFEKLDDYLNHLRYAVCTWSLNKSSILHWKVFLILFLYFWKDKKKMEEASHYGEADTFTEYLTFIFEIFVRHLKRIV
jgi:hypothetical protein